MSIRADLTNAETFLSRGLPAAALPFLMSARGRVPRIRNPETRRAARRLVDRAVVLTKAALLCEKGVCT